MTIADDAPPVTADSTFHLRSCSKLITTIAALQCVERGQISLDDPVDKHLPELAKQPIISFNGGEARKSQQFEYTAATKKITLRQLLTHTSGVGYDMMDPRLRAWRQSRGEAPLALTGRVLEGFSTPLVHEPGEGWAYGGGIDWAGVLISRLNGNVSLEAYMGANIFAPLGMQSITFHPEQRPDMRARLVQTVTRAKDGTLVDFPPENNHAPRDDSGGAGLYSTVADFMAVLRDLMQDEPTLLTKHTVDLLFAPQIADDSPAMRAFRRDRFVYDWVVGALTRGVQLNWGLGGLLVLDDSPTLGRTKGTVCWGGASGVVWAINRDVDVCGVSAEQVRTFPYALDKATTHERFWEHLFSFAK